MLTKSSPFFNWSYEIMQSTIVFPAFLFMNFVYMFTLPIYIIKLNYLCYKSLWCSMTRCRMIFVRDTQLSPIQDCLGRFIGTLIVLISFIRFSSSLCGPTFLLNSNCPKKLGNFCYYIFWNLNLNFRLYASFDFLFFSDDIKYFWLKRFPKFVSQIPQIF